FRHGPAERPDEVAMGFQQFTFEVVAGPCELDHPRPVVEVLHRCTVVHRQAVGFGVEEEDHSRGVSLNVIPSGWNAESSFLTSARALPICATVSLNQLARVLCRVRWIFTQYWATIFEAVTSFSSISSS